MQLLKMMLKTRLAALDFTNECNFSVIIISKINKMTSQYV